MIIAFLHDNTNLFHNHDYFDTEYAGKQYSSVDYEFYLTSYYNEYWATEYQRWITIMKYAGIIVFVGALPFLKNSFVKQIALPKKY
jgi:hypothetical protein